MIGKIDDTAGLINQDVGVVHDNTRLINETDNTESTIN